MFKVNLKKKNREKRKHPKKDHLSLLKDLLSLINASYLIEAKQQYFLLMS